MSDVAKKPPDSHAPTTHAQVAHRLGRLIGLFGRLEARLSATLRKLPDDVVPDEDFMHAAKVTAEGMVRTANELRGWQQSEAKKLSELTDEQLDKVVDEQVKRMLDADPVKTRAYLERGHRGDRRAPTLADLEAAAVEADPT